MALKTLPAFSAKDVSLVFVWCCLFRRYHTFRFHLDDVLAECWESSWMY